MITFFHTADIHFGVENYGKVDSKTGIHSRLLDFKKSFESCIDLAIKENIDLFLLCGDAYKTAYPTPTQQKLFAQLLLKLHQANIPVAITVGNHDHPLSFGKANALDVFDYLPLDGFHVFSKPDAITIETKNGPLQIVGIPWPTRNVLMSRYAHKFKSNSEIATYLSDKVGQIIQTLASELNPELPAILMGHLTVSNGLFSGSEKCAVFGTDPIFLPSQLAIEPFDYVALGHLHRHQNLNPKSSPAIIYSGSVERVDFGERKDEKGFYRVQIDTSKNKTCTHTFVKLPTRPMIQIDVKLKAGENQTEQILEATKQHDITNAIVKIIYHVPENRPDKVNLASIQRACKDSICLVGIIPIHKAATRERRAQVKIDMDLKTLLNRYFDTKENLSERKEILIEKALKLTDVVDDKF